MTVKKKSRKASAPAILSKMRANAHLMEFKDTEKPEMPAAMQKLQADIASALDQLGKAVDTKNKQTIDNITKEIQKYDDLHTQWQKDVKAWEERAKLAEAKANDTEGRLKDLETKIATGLIGHNGGPELDDENHPGRKTEEYKAFFEGFVQCNSKLNVTPETKAMLRTDIDTAGGFLIPPVFDNQIRKKVVELSPVRSFATSKTLTGKTMNVPIRLALLDSSYEGEAEDDNDDASKYGETSVNAHRHSVTVPITLDQLIMSPYNMEQEIASDVGQSFAKKEGKMFLVGTGNGMPEGMLVNSAVLAGKTLTAATGIVTFDDIATLIGSMKTGYNAILSFNRLTFAQLIQLKDKYGRPLWQPVAGDRPATIWDEPYTKTFIDMDSMIPATYSGDTLTANATSGTIPIMYADFKQGYEIYDLMGMSVIRDDVTRKKRAIIEYTFRRYNTAKVQMAEAIKVLKVR
jgi:HK97 family phage major capsid protein